MSKKTQKDLDHQANQRNPNNYAYKKAQDNHSVQLNPNNSKFQPKKGD